MNIPILLLLIYNSIFVLVGDSGNPPSINENIGSVDYDFEIMAAEVSNREYVDFLNSVACDNDEYGLYSPIMTENFMGGIIREEIEGKYTYKVKDGFENYPVIGVSWNSAARYVNWLNYNSDKIENKDDISGFRPLTEGDENRGSYNLNVKNPHKNNAAVYWLPNRDEWIKAGYYNGDHWEENFLPEGSNIYSQSKGWKYPFPHIKETRRGVAPSYYGTYDQQGNLAEWIEDGDPNNGFKFAMGGSLIRSASYARFNENEGDFPDKSIPSFGFRVARSNDIEKRKLTPDTIIYPEIKILQDQTSIKQVKDNNGGTYVLVDHIGNPGDIVNQLKGSVYYHYYISKYEISNEEYCNFLNSVASISDIYNLYDPNMETGITGGIKRTKDNNRWKYSVKEGWEKKPVTYLGFYELARFANWLHFGTPNGEQVIGITEGTPDKGAYDTSDFESVRNGLKKPYKNFGKRNERALYWIPNDDEWYKAAYFDPEKLGNRKYHDYPTRTSDKPTASEANYMQNNRYVVGPPFYLADIDAYPGSVSYFGTQQQGGNVWEWTESWQYGNPGNRSLRGGSWQYTEFGLNALNEDPGGINDKSYVYGGRLCKSVDDTGYHAADIPLKDKIYNSVLLLSKNKIVFIVIGSALFGGVLIILSILLIIKWFGK